MKYRDYTCICLTIVMTWITTLYAQDSLNVSLVKSWYLSEWATKYDITVNNDYAYVATGSTGLYIIDISDLENPAEVGHFDTPGIAMRVLVSGIYAYIGDGSGGVRIIDVSDPANPIEAGFLYMPGPANDIAKWGDILYVANGSAGLRVVDVSDPQNPVEINSYIPNGSISSVDVNDIYVFLNTVSHFFVLNASDPYNLINVGQFFNGGGTFTTLEINGDYAYIGDNWFYTIWILDVSHPALPTLAANTGFGDLIWSFTAYENSLYVTNEDVLTIYDVTDPAFPLVAGIYDGVGYSTSLFRNGDYLNSTGVTVNVEIFDVSDPGNVIELCEYVEAGDIYHVEISGEYAYIAEGSCGLRIFDISNPLDPVWIGFCDVDGYVLEVAVSGDYAFIPNQELGLHIIDISDPENPFLAGCYDPPETFVFHVAVIENYAFLSTMDNGTGALSVVDVSNPANPIQIGYLETFNLISDLDVWGNWVYALCNTGNGLNIINVADPSDPVEVGNCALSWNYYNITACEEYAYVGGSPGVLVIDVRNHSNPIAVGSCSTPSTVYQIALLNNDYICLADHESGFRVLDVSDPSNPFEVGYYETPGMFYSVDAAGMYAFVACVTCLNVYDCSDALGVIQEKHYAKPKEFTLLPPHPNPFNSTTVLSFQLPVATNVKFEIFDINGCNVGAQHAAPLPGNQWYPAGIHHVLFDGAGLASGIYFCRLQAGGYTSSAKILLLK